VICYHCGVLAAWSRQNWNTFEKFLRFFGKTTPYDKIFRILFGKFTWRYRSTLLCAKFVKIVWREIGEIVRYLNDKETPKILAPFQTVATARIAPKVCHCQPPSLGSQCSKFHPNRFTFGGVIAVRVKAVKTRLKVFPILGEAIASRWVMTTSRLVRFATYGHEHTVKRRLAISCGNQSCHSCVSRLPSARLWSFSLFMVFAEPLPHRPGSLQSLPVQVGADTVAELLV